MVKPAFPGLPPAVVVHGLPAARAVRAHGRPATLLSAPGALAYAGLPWWEALVARANSPAGPAPLPDILDFGLDAAAALAAILAGHTRLVLRPDAPGIGAAMLAAAQRGAVLATAPPPALDSALPGYERGLAAWLDDKAGRLR